MELKLKKKLKLVMDLMPDWLYLKIMYRRMIGKSLNLKNPQTFNEKMQWLKLHNRNDKYTMMVDKYLVRSYIAEKLGERYLIPLLGVWDSPEDISFETLPGQFVLKCNHNSGLGMFICKNKSEADFEQVKKGLLEGEKQDYYIAWREWPYKNVPRKIICEKYMTNDGEELDDYKFFCFNGEVKCFKIDFNRFSNHRANYYDTEMNLLPFCERDFPSDPSRKFSKPDNFEEMVRLAERLSQGIPFLRVDFYNINGKVYFGEMTFYPGAGFGKFEPEEWDEILGSWLKLPIDE